MAALSVFLIKPALSSYWQNIGILPWGVSLRFCNKLLNSHTFYFFFFLVRLTKGQQWLATFGNYTLGVVSIRLALLQEREGGLRGWSNPRSHPSPWDSCQCGFVASHRKEFKRCHSKAKEVLFRQEAHSIDRVWTVSEGKRSPGYGVVKFYRVK